MLEIAKTPQVEDPSGVELLVKARGARDQVPIEIRMTLELDLQRLLVGLYTPQVRKDKNFVQRYPWQPRAGGPES